MGGTNRFSAWLQAVPTVTISKVVSAHTKSVVLVDSRAMAGWPWHMGLGDLLSSLRGSPPLLCALFTPKFPCECNICNDKCT